ncbi:hypothetical protein VARIO8X_60483 [Burkholderiales bacterium 8X]|nr:hypothetical protein VARIO8X_60483 [Burkholderiales bacterium 8X]
MRRGQVSPNNRPERSRFEVTKPGHRHAAKCPGGPMDHSRQRGSMREVAPLDGKTTHEELRSDGFWNAGEAVDEHGRWTGLAPGRIMLVATAKTMASTWIAKKQTVAELKLTKGSLSDFANEALAKLLAPYRPGIDIELSAYCMAPKGFAIGSALLVARDLVMRWPELYPLHQAFNDCAPSASFRHRQPVSTLARGSGEIVLIDIDNDKDTDAKVAVVRERLPDGVVLGSSAEFLASSLWKEA